MSHPSALIVDAHCRACQATFGDPLPTPYGGICPFCLATGDIVTLTARPRTAAGAARARRNRRGMSSTLRHEPWHGPSIPRQNV